MTDRRRIIRLAFAACVAELGALVLSPLIGEAEAFSLASVAFVVLSYWLRCQSLWASIAFGACFFVYALLIAMHGPLVVNGAEVSFVEFPWSQFLLLVLLGTPLALHLIAPLASAVLVHWLLHRVSSLRASKGA